MSTKRLFSLEDIAEDEVRPVDSSAELDAVRYEDEITTEADDIVETTTAIDEAVDAADRLETTGEVVQQAVDTGAGLDPVAAEMTQVAVESIMARIGGVGFGKKVIASTESFGGTNTRLHSTKVALEGIIESIKAIWIKVKEFLKQVWQKISDFFTKFFDNTDRVAKAIKASREKVEAVAGKKAEASIESKALAAGFSVDGKFNVDNIAKIFRNHLAMTKASEQFVKLCESGVSAVNELAKSKDGKAELAKLEKLTVEIVENVKLCTAPKTKQKTNKDGVSVTVVEHGPYYMGRKLVFRAEGSEEKGLISASFEIKDSEVADTAKVKVLTKDEMMTALDGAEELNKATADFKKNAAFFKTLNAESDKIIASVFKIAEAITDQSENNSLVKRNLSAAKAGLTSLTSVAARYNTMTPSWNVGICNKIISAVNECAAAYK